ncbi:MAG TPA: uroporphyrinogen-III synthase [Oligoflexia bacterium]|nr:uroporphyrinogen-III synthase [Oligoflexia bacterium]
MRILDHFGKKPKIRQCALAANIGYCSGKMDLSNYTFLNTRPRKQAAELTALLERLGSTVIEFPLLEIVPCSPTAAESAAIAQLKPDDWIVFTSANGVQAAFSSYDIASSFDRGIRAAAIGEPTAEALRKVSFAPGFVARESNSASFAQELIEYLTLSGHSEQRQRRLLLLRGRSASAELPQLLSQPGFDVQEIVVYDSAPPRPSVSALKKLHRQLGIDHESSNACSGSSGMIDMIIFTSSLAAKNLIEVLAAAGTLTAAQQMKLVCLPAAVIGPRTERTVKELGFKTVVSAEEATVESLVTAVRWHYRASTQGQPLNKT